MGLLGCLSRGFFYSAIVFVAVSFIPGIPPKTHFSIEPITYAPLRELKGPLAVNKLLDDGERLFEGEVFGPECLRKRGNDLYVAQLGVISKINGKKITQVATFGKPTDYFNPEVAGRPLGFEFDTQSNSLIAVDAYFGIWSVDLDTGRKTQLVTPEQILPGDIPRPAKIFNSLAVASNGDIYWTDSSSDFKLIDGFYTFLANPAGRLFRYDRKTRKNHVLLDRLHFANGVVLSPDESFVIVAETAASRLIKVFLTGPKAGTSVVFVDGLPGGPDNLSADSHGIWVPLVVASDGEHPFLWQSAGPAPYIRVFLLRLINMIEFPFKIIDQMYPNCYCKSVLNHIGSFEPIGRFFVKKTTVVRVDWNGNIVSSLHGVQHELLSDVLETENEMYLGSFRNNYILRIATPKNIKRGELFAGIQPSTTTTTTRKPTTTTTTQKPTTTTTTPKPTTTTTTTTTPKPPAPTTTPKPSTTTTPKPPTTTTTPKPATTSTTPKPTTTTTPKPATTTTQKPAATTTTTQKPLPVSTTTTTTTSKPEAVKPAMSATDTQTAPPPPPPPTPKEPPRVVPTVQPIEEVHEEPTQTPRPIKMKVIKRGGEQGEF